MNLIINDLEQLKELGKKIHTILDDKKAKFVLLCGRVGIGKTTLAKFIMESMGHNGETKSPTFNIVNQYNLSNKVVFHIDLYRIEDKPYEFLQEYIQDGDVLIIEWADNVIGKLNPKSCIKVLMDISGEIRIAEVS